MDEQEANGPEWGHAEADRALGLAFYSRRGVASVDFSFFLGSPSSCETSKLTCGARNGVSLDDGWGRYTWCS